ncbi:MAG: hypothetical protein ACOX7U_07500 [Desulfitobacteriia bacterium]|jgi:hypothetical protein
MLNMLFWGFFLQIVIFALAVAAIGWIVMLIIFKVKGIKLGEDETN